MKIDEIKFLQTITESENKINELQKEKENLVTTNHELLTDVINKKAKEWIEENKKAIIEETLGDSFKVLEEKLQEENQKLDFLKSFISSEEKQEVNEETEIKE